jgi:hypothetical protein
VTPSLRSPYFDFVMTFKTQLGMHMCCRPISIHSCHTPAAQTFFSKMDALIRVHRHARELNAVLEARMDKQIKFDSIDSFRSSVAARRMI